MYIPHGAVQGAHNHGKMHSSGSNRQAPGGKMQDHGSMNMPQPSGAVGAASAKEPLRGVILIVASKDVVLQGVWDALWRHILILIAAVIVILRIAYLALNHQVIRPLESICDTINRWKSSRNDATNVFPNHFVVASSIFTNVVVFG